MYKIHFSLRVANILLFRLFFHFILKIKLRHLTTVTVCLSLNYSPGNNAVSRQMYSVAPHKMFR